MTSTIFALQRYAAEQLKLYVSFHLWTSTSKKWFFYQFALENTGKIWWNLGGAANDKSTCTTDNKTRNNFLDKGKEAILSANT